MLAKIANQVVDRMGPKARPYEVNDTELRGFLLRVQPSGRKTYFCSFRLRDGKRTRVKIGASDCLMPRQAREIARQVLARVVQGEDPSAEKVRSDWTLGEYLSQKYGPWLVANRPKTAAETIERIKKIFEDLAHQPLGEVTPWMIEKWRAARIRDGIKPLTINRDLGALKPLFSRAVEWGDLQIDPIARVRLLKVDVLERVRFLTQQEENRLLRALHEREAEMRAARRRGNAWRAVRAYPSLPTVNAGAFADHLLPMVLVALHTGLRRGELLKLSPKQVVLAPPASVTVAAANAKSGKSRHVPLNAVAAKTLSEWLRQVPEDSTYVFPGRDGAMMKDARTAWTSVLRKAGIQGFRWHDLRHQFASKLVMRGVDLNTVRELLGHADLKMTLRYAHLAPEIKAKAVALLEAPQALESVSHCYEYKNVRDEIDLPA